MSETLTIEEVAQVTNPKRVLELVATSQEPRMERKDVHFHEFEVDVETEWWSENYGSDADGNRGERRSYSENSSGNLITILLHVKRDGKYKTLRREIDLNKISDGEVVSQIESAVESYEPEPPPSREDCEPDYDEDR